MKKILFALWFLISPLSANATQSSPAHGVSTFGSLKYPEDFTHYDYTNPQAPKGGTLRLGQLGTFDSLNLYIVQGVQPGLALLTAATLLDAAKDCIGEGYAYGAESVELAPDSSWVIFRLNPKAKFNNGDPITADDVLWVFETLKTQGMPMYRTYYKNIKKAEKLDTHTVKFSFDTTSIRELPLILGQLPLLSKKYYETHSFSKPSLQAAPASGPYEIDTIIAGRTIILKRVKNWWGENLPSQKGSYNFDIIRADYYFENNALFLGFQADQYDLRQESSAKQWVTGYTFPAYAKGHVKKEEIKPALPIRTTGYSFNLRRPLFSDIRVRKALTLLFDFPWINKNLFYGLYKRNESYFPGSDFEAQGQPSEEEKTLLKPFEADLLPEILSQKFTLPAPNTEEERRNLQMQAISLLEEAGFKIQNGVMIQKNTGTPLTFEILTTDKTSEKIVLNFASTLKRIGIQVTIRTLDVAAYQLRVDNLDYDMIATTIPQSENLGNEQRDYFGSEKANVRGTNNFSGIRNPVVDQLIEQLIHAKDYKTLVNASKSLDRVLLWNYYMIPAWRSEATRVAYWNRFSHPTTPPKYRGFDITTWWFDEEKANALKQSPKVEEKSSQPSTWRKLQSWFFGEEAGKYK